MPEPLVRAAAVALEQATLAGSTRSRRDVYFELLVTAGLFAIPEVLNSIFGYFASGLAYGTAGHQWLFASRAVQELLFVGLFFYVLRANQERLADFTRPAAWMDVPRCIGLLFAMWIPYAALMIALWRGMPLDERLPRNTMLLRSQLSLPYLSLLVVNPFCEELWMRAFLQTRLGQVGWRAPVIVVTSASLQAAYHLYQGVSYAVGYAVVFCVLASYYQRTRRVWPIVAVHLIADVSAGILYSGALR